MSSFVRTIAALFLAGCYEHHLCGTDEICNLDDDDCDGFVDEGFVDEDGAYVTIDHCGECGLSCERAFPTAEEVACEPMGELGPTCVLVSCPDGFHRGDEGSCAPDVPVLCLPCEDDDDCALRIPGARCLETGSGQSRCGQPCDRAPCPEGFSCVEGQCAPESGWCNCSELTEDVELACLLHLTDRGHACVGVMRCGAGGPGECEPALMEACNLVDDDCDGETDEDYRDDEGRYVDRFHCGGCAIPCVEPGPNMIAECLPNGPGVRCRVECLEGFVDVDRILANGCECERWDGMGPPPVIGGDSDCDGLPDDTDLFIYVTTTGSDTNPGTLARPMRTLGAALARGLASNKDVLVARGIYEGPLDVVGGVSIFGGYSPDFRDRDLELYPVVVERREAEAGMPALTCRNVSADTRVEGFTIVGGDAVGAGRGSTAMYVDGCGSAVSFAALTILAGRASDGSNGADSSDRLVEWGLMSLDQLDGNDGAGGAPGNGEGMSCVRVAGGAGGSHMCRRVDVSGGAGGAAACPETGCVNGSPCGNAGCTDYTVGGVCDFDAVLRDAVPNPAASAGRGPGAGVAGVLVYNAPTNRGVCNFCDDNPTLPRDSAHGGDGANGGDGSGGVGCAAAPVLDVMSGRVSGGAGTNGGDGTDGGGGGGASSGAGYDVIGGTSGGCTDRSGGSGGGGGSGGCGAPGATAGSGGGTSIGIAIRSSAGAGPSFEDVRVVTASGGRGGGGGVGADGGIGGVGGNGGVGRFWCARTGGRGGDGGRGGAGGGGGGGCGGGSHAVYLVRGDDAYADELAMTLTIEQTGVAGNGGQGGFSPGASGADGRDGSDEAILRVP